jgi:hypothetical protein
MEELELPEAHPLKNESGKDVIVKDLLNFFLDFFVLLLLLLPFGLACLLGVFLLEFFCIMFLSLLTFCGSNPLWTYLSTWKQILPVNPQHIFVTYRVPHKVIGLGANIFFFNTLLLKCL